ncbi:alanine racemase [Bianquea renquensis]|jgi:alanine racemase domain protein|uniref:Alanine racemase n=1 Tax=Bianquea renquensis TaxID=2763661 RepID=A0A926DUP7_9FIRM|nr:alanine racemase [Bianquea renquensis]MBC8543600.1 alanine racemase [Bianquea renquensis]
MRVDELSTPALILDMDRFRENGRRMQRLMEGSRAHLRPHFKSHKCSRIAKLQMEAGAKGITCAKLAEAEVLVEAGIPDILIANQVVQPSKIAELAYWARKTRITVCVDDPVNIQELERAAHLAGSRIYVYVELDVGMQRCGVSDFEQVLYLARQIEQSEHLVFGGIQAYAGQLSHEEDVVKRNREIHKIEALLRQGKAYLEQHHVTVKEISGASTATAGEKAKGGVYTEIQAGSYLFMDTSYRRCGVPFENALSIVSTIISKTDNRIVLDVGVKNLGMDQREPEMAGQRSGDVLSFSEEHTAIYRNGIGTCNSTGSQVEILPGHCCTTANTFDWIMIKEGDEILDRWRIDGRGKSW